MQALPGLRFTTTKRTVVRGGFGVYYRNGTFGNFGATYALVNTDPTVAFDLNYNNATLNPYCTQGVVSCTSGVPTAYQHAVQEVLAAALATFTFPNFNPPGGTVTIGPNTYVIPALPSLPPTAVFDVDQNIRHPGALDATMGVAQQMGEAFGVSGGFQYTHGFNEYIIHNININPITFLPIYSTFGSISDYSKRTLVTLISTALGYRLIIGIAAVIVCSWPTRSDTIRTTALAGPSA